MTVRLKWVLVLSLVSGVSRHLLAQSGTSSDTVPTTLFVPVGSSTESYLRYHQTLGTASLTSWTVRSFSPATITNLVDGSEKKPYLDADRPVHKAGDLLWQAVPVAASLWYNTTYPFGWNDGAVWRGRGATMAVEGGFAVRWKFLSATIDPTFFMAENRRFALMAIRDSSTNPYADPLGSSYMDRPQRFGNRAYARVDAGQTTLRIDTYGLSAGVSTANQWIGPMSDWPFLLGNNAAGFPQLFAGSSAPWNVGIGSVSGRIFYGGLTQTAYMSLPDSNTGRFITGIMGSFSPAALPGLELGAARIFEYTWPAAGLGWEDYRKPFEAFLKEHVKPDGVSTEPNQRADNQLVSIFARWVAPRSGFEAYGEFGRDDHNYNARDAVLEPDHDASYGLGLRKAWRSAAGIVTGVRAETFNMEVSTLARGRPQGMWYGHSEARQGHTQLGQILGAGFAAVAGAGSLFGVERFSNAGERSAFSLIRMVMREGDAEPARDVQYALTGERTRRLGTFRLTYGATGVYNLHRYFAGDVGNVMGSISLTW
jgi:hypothetical protein